MFGYVRPQKSELLMREYEEYKAVYCTLCKELGKNYGRRTKFVLSYDITFYTMLALGIEKTQPIVKQGRCAFNPIKKCNYICEGDLAYKKGSALTVLMSYFKFMDTVEDEGFFKSLAARFFKLLLSRPKKKAERDFPEMAKAVEDYMVEQKEVETAKEFNFDACCQPTANALSKIFENLSDDKIQKTVLAQVGYFLGRWIYLMDASDDLREDLESGNFNPFIKYYNIKEKALTDEEFEEYEEKCNESLNFTVSMLISALNLLDLGRYESIIENIVTKGLGQVQKEILFLHVHVKKKKEKNKPH